MKCMIVLVGLLSVLSGFIVMMVPVLSGFVAKRVCSITFIASRDLESIWKYELRSPLAKTISPEIDFHNKRVTTRFLSLLFPRTAFYREGLGCSLHAEETQGKRKDLSTLGFNRSKLSDTIPWPYGDADDITPVAHQKKLEGILEHQVNKFDTRALVVIKDGKLVAEKYKKGFNKHSKLIGWSMTKSLLNLLFGVRVRQGKLALSDQPFSSGFMESEDPQVRSITVDQLLRASSGLRFDESYPNYKAADPSTMLFNTPDTAKYASQKGSEHKPDTVWSYSSGTTNMLSQWLRQSFPESSLEYWKFPYEQLFSQIDAHSFILETDPNDTFVASSFGWATARDWARIGQLMLNKGKWNGKQVVSSDWVEYSVKPTPTSARGEYGAQWWLNAGNTEERKWPKLPKDLVWAHGYESQIVAFVPSRNVVIVHLGCFAKSPVLDEQEEQLLHDILGAL